MLVGDVGAKALTAVFVLLSIRVLSPAEFAAYVYLSALIVLSVTTLNGFFNRHFIMASANALLARSYWLLQVASSLLIFGCAMLLLGRDVAPAAMLAGFFCVACASSFDFRRTYAQKTQAFRAYVVGDIVRAFFLLTLSGPILLWWKEQAIPALFATQGVAFLVGSSLLPSLPRSISKKVDVRSIIVGRHSIALLIYFVLVGFFGQLPVLILRQVADDNAVATFGSAFRYYGLALAIVIAANVVVLPRIAASTNLRATLTSLVPLLLVAILFLSVAASAGYLIIPLIDEGKYPDAPMLFAILCAGLVPGILLAPMTAVFLRLESYHHLIASQLASIVVCAALGFCYFKWGTLASAIGLSSGVAVQLLWLLFAAGGAAVRSK